MKNLNDYSNFQLSNKSKKTIFGGHIDSEDHGIINGNCTLDPIGDAIRKKLGL